MWPTYFTAGKKKNRKTTKKKNKKRKEAKKKRETKKQKKKATVYESPESDAGENGLLFFRVDLHHMNEHFNSGHRCRLEVGVPSAFKHEESIRHTLPSRTGVSCYR